jgi:hypothetical protein
MNMYDIIIHIHQILLRLVQNIGLFSSNIKKSYKKLGPKLKNPSK